MSALQTVDGRPHWLTHEDLKKKVDMGMVAPKKLTTSEWHKAIRENRIAEAEEGHHVATLLEQAEIGDEVYAYDNIEMLSGSAGYVLIRDGKVAAVVTTVRS